MGQWMYYLRVTPAELEKLKADPSSAVDFVLYEERREEREFTTEKTWMAIDYLLAKGIYAEDPHLSELIQGGKVIEGAGLDTNLRYFTQAEVKEMASALLKVTHEQLLAPYDPKKMNELYIYPTAWGEDVEFDHRYITDWFDTLVRGFSKAAQRDEAVLVYLGL
jgi:hypothetical protein